MQFGRRYGIIHGVDKKSMKSWTMDFFRIQAHGMERRVNAVSCLLVPPPLVVIMR